MDSTYVEILKDLLDHLVQDENKPGLLRDFIPIISVVVGAFIALGSQFFFYLHSSRKERKRILLEAYSDCERITYLLGESFKELNMYKTHKKYFYRLFEIYGDSDNKDDAEKYQRRHTESNQEMLEVLNKIRTLTSEYYKNIAKFRKQIGENTTVSKNMVKFMNYEKEKSRGFDDITDTRELFKEEEKEERRLNEIYNKYTDHLKIINNEIYARI